MEKTEIFRKTIIKWYELYGDHHLPWRKTRDPWAVLVAAFLLRKTTAEQVLTVYDRILKRFPSPRDVLQTSAEEIEELIKPLGIEHQRSRHLIELASSIVERFGGEVPCSREELKRLAGVGDYIASEVLLVSCGVPEPLLDRNMIRILERFFGVKANKKRAHTDPAMWSFARTLVPQDPEAAKLYNYGVLDFARNVCKARKPHCTICPLQEFCSYRLQGLNRRI